MGRHRMQADSAQSHVPNALWPSFLLDWAVRGTVQILDELPIAGLKLEGVYLYVVFLARTIFLLSRGR